MKLEWGFLVTSSKFDWEAETTPLGSSNKINLKQPDAVAAQTHQIRNTFKEFAAVITIGKNVILIIHPEERYGNPNKL